MENLRFNIAAGETKVFVKAGRYFEILDSNGPVTIAFYDASGTQCNDATNVLSGTYLEDAYSQFDISSVTAQTIEILISDGKGGTRRTPGVVSVIDTDKATTELGRAFAGGASSGTPAAGQFATVQISNPAGSGKRLIIEVLQIEAQAAAVQTLIGITSTVYGIAPTTLRSKLSGGGNSASAIVTKSDHAADPGPLVPSLAFWGAALAPNAAAVYRPKRPIVILPGYQLTAACRTAAAGFTVTTEIYEESI